VAIHDDDLGRARRTGAADSCVDLFRIETPSFLEERLAAVALLGLDDPGDSFDVTDDVNAHESSFPDGRAKCAAFAL
jgi:hypothetical protein